MLREHVRVQIYCPRRVHLKMLARTFTLIHFGGCVNAEAWLNAPTPRDLFCKRSVLAMKNIAVVRCTLPNLQLFRSRRRLWNACSTRWTCAEFWIRPERFHGLAEMIDNVGARKLLVIHKRIALLAVKNQVLSFGGWSPAFNHKAKRIWSALRSVRHSARNKHGFALAQNDVSNSMRIAYANGHISLQLHEVFFGIGHVIIVARVGAGDQHHKEILAAEKIFVRHWRHHQVAVRRGPRGQVDRACHAARAVPSGGIAKWVIGGKWRGNDGGWIDGAHANQFTFYELTSQAHKYDLK